MINIVLLVVLVVVLLISVYDLATGYCFLIAVLLLIPQAAFSAKFFSAISNFGMLTLGYSLIVYFKKQQQFVLANKYFTRVFSIYFAICLFLFLFSTVVPKNQQFSIYLLEFLSILLAYLGYLVLDNYVVLGRFLKFLLFSLSIIGIYGLYTLISHSNPYVDLIDLYYKAFDNDFRTDGLDMARGAVGVRIQSVFDHPLTLGQICALFFSFFVLIKSRIKPLISTFLLILTGLLIFFSGSRSALVSIFPPILVIFTSLKWNQKLFLFSLFLLFLFLFDMNFFHLSPELNRTFKASIFFWDSSLQSQANFEGSSIDMRIDQFNAALLKLEKTNPLTGFGIGYREYYQKLTNGLDPDLLGYESVFLLKPVEQGIVGTFAIFYLIYNLFSYASKIIVAYFKPEKIKILAYFFSFIIGIVMTGIRPNALLFFLLLYFVYIKILELGLPVKKLVKSDI